MAQGVDAGQVIHQYALHFANNDAPKVALEYYMLAARARLHLFNLQISDLLEPALDNPSQNEALESLLLRAADAAAKLAASGAASDEVERVAFQQLQTSRQLLQAQRQ